VSISPLLQRYIFVLYQDPFPTRASLLAVIVVTLPSDILSSSLFPSWDLSPRNHDHSYTFPITEIAYLSIGRPPFYSMRITSCLHPLSLFPPFSPGRGYSPPFLMRISVPFTSISSRGATRLMIIPWTAWVGLSEIITYFSSLFLPRSAVRHVYLSLENMDGLSARFFGWLERLSLPPCFEMQCNDQNPFSPFGGLYSFFTT